MLKLYISKLHVIVLYLSIPSSPNLRQALNMGRAGHPWAHLALLPGAIIGTEGQGLGIRWTKGSHHYPDSCFIRAQVRNETLHQTIAMTGQCQFLFSSRQPHRVFFSFQHPHSSIKVTKISLSISAHFMCFQFVTGLGQC